MNILLFILSPWVIITTGRVGRDTWAAKYNRPYFVYRTHCVRPNSKEWIQPSKPIVNEAKLCNFLALSLSYFLLRLNVHSGITLLSNLGCDWHAVATVRLAGNILYDLLSRIWRGYWTWKTNQPTSSQDHKTQWQKEGTLKRWEMERSQNGLEPTHTKHTLTRT